MMSKRLCTKYIHIGEYMAEVTGHGIPGVEISTGSLGHGLPVGCGMALAGKRENKPYRVYVMLSDGELDEGSKRSKVSVRCRK